MAQGTGLTGPQARDLLGRFLFSGDQVEKPVEVLSGGERRRLALARVVVGGANFLVLDEPTNHLDIESREALEDALTEYRGTPLLVSHDRALIEALATRTIAIEDGRLRLREGASASTPATTSRRLRAAAKRPPPGRPRRGAQPRRTGRPSARPERRPGWRGDRRPGGGAGLAGGAALAARRVRRRRRWSRTACATAPGGARPHVPRVGAARGQAG